MNHVRKNGISIIRQSNISFSRIMAFNNKHLIINQIDKLY